MKGISRKLIVIWMGAFSVSALFGQSYWFEDYDEALQTASERNVPLLLFFTGSDWCHWCGKLERELFEDAELKQRIEELVVPVKLDFPRKRQTSPRRQRRLAELKNQFSVENFPSVLLVDPSHEKVYLIHGYGEIEASQYLQLLEYIRVPSTI